MQEPTSGWTEANIPCQRGRTALITGANGGLGAETARALARAGAKVILACRSLEKGEAVMATLHGRGHEVASLDLSDLASVSSCATALRQRGETIDLLILNAGIMAIPRQLTDTGHERQLGTNHIGHFALAAQLLPLMNDGGRVVSVSSQAHRMTGFRWHDPMGERRYNPWIAYGQSKLANLLFAFELDRRLRAEKRPLASLAAHPGYANTELQHVAPRMTGAKLSGWLMRAGNASIAQSAAQGALPTLRAATDPACAGGDYIGPDGWFEWRGAPVKVSASAAANDVPSGTKLWDLSEGWASVQFSVGKELAGGATLKFSEGPDPTDHADEAVAPVGGDVVAELEPVKQIAEVEIDDLGGSATVVQAEDDGHQPLDDDRV